MQIDINTEFKKAFDLLEYTNQNAFVTGCAGTGKSTLLKYFRHKTKKKIVVLAPTGVAAVNVQGQTIHSFFGFKPQITLDFVKQKIKNNLYKKIDTIIIDEVSMVRADLLDCVDKFLRLNGQCRNKPFGSVQMIFIGDLYQLPPVVKSEEALFFCSYYKTAYFFGAHVFQHIDINCIELTKIYRQKDKEYINLLNKIRNDTITAKELEIINAQLFPSVPSKEFIVYLTPTNAHANIINDERLEKIQMRLHAFKAKIAGNFKKEYFPAPEYLELKEGAQIMMLNNDIKDRWINGTIGCVLNIEDEYIKVKLQNGQIYDVKPYSWDIFRYELRGGNIEPVMMGRFKQYPMMLSWAITIHKSQGKTFEKMVLDIGRGTFAYGQIYVALSRCTCLSGVYLKKPINKRHIFMDNEIGIFLKKVRNKCL